MDLPHTIQQLQERHTLWGGYWSGWSLVFSIAPKVSSADLVDEQFKDAFGVVLVGIIEIPFEIIHQFVCIWQIL